MMDWIVDFITNNTNWYKAVALSVFLFILTFTGILDIHWLWSMAPFGLMLAVFGILFVLVYIMDNIAP